MLTTFGALRGGPLHPGDDPRLDAAAVVVEHLAVEQRGLRGDALVLAAGRRAGAGRDARHVGAVAVVVAGVRCSRRSSADVDPAGEVGVAGVDAGVQDRDLHALAGQPALPGGRRADLRHAAVERGRHPVVERDPFDRRSTPQAPAQKVAGGRTCATAHGAGADAASASGSGPHRRAWPRGPACARSPGCRRTRRSPAASPTGGRRTAAAIRVVTSNSDRSSRPALTPGRGRGRDDERCGRRRTS